MEKNDYLTFRAYNILFFMVAFIGMTMFGIMTGSPERTEYWFETCVLGYLPGFIIYRYIAPPLIDSNFLRFRRPNRKRRKGGRFKRRGDGLPELSEKRQRFYYDEGLDDEDIRFFRKQMAKSKRQILSIEKFLGQSTKLNVIAKRYDLIDILQDYFKAICNHPKRMNEAEAFLYSYVPTFTDIAQKFIDIQGHVSKSKMTYQTLNRSLETLEALCQNIKRSYESFMEEDIEDIGINLQLIEERMKKEQALLSAKKADEDLAVPDMSQWFKDPDKELEEILVNAPKYQVPKEKNGRTSPDHASDFDEF